MVEFAFSSGVKKPPGKIDPFHGTQQAILPRFLSLMQMNFCASKIPYPMINVGSWQIEGARVEQSRDFGCRVELSDGFIPEARAAVGHWAIAGMLGDVWGGQQGWRMLRGRAGPRWAELLVFSLDNKIKQTHKQTKHTHKPKHTTRPSPGWVFQESEAQNRFSCRCRSGTSFTCNPT